MLMRTLLCFVLLLVACSNPTPSAPAGPRAQTDTTAARSVPKTLTMGVNDDLKNLWDITASGASDARQVGHIVNQYLVAITADGSAQPRLLAELPSIERGTWRVTADGKME